MCKSKLQLQIPRFIFRFLISIRKILFEFVKSNLVNRVFFCRLHIQLEILRFKLRSIDSIEVHRFNWRLIDSIGYSYIKLYIPIFNLKIRFEFVKIQIW